MRCDGILNDFELQRNNWKQCILSMYSDGILNDLELQRKNENNVS